MMDNVNDIDDDLFSEDFQHSDLLAPDIFSKRKKCPKRKLEERLDELKLQRETDDYHYFD